MKYGDAFRKLGYKLVAPRSDWTAEKSDGICLTLWRSEIDWEASPIKMESRVDAGPVEAWAPAGNNKRKLHLAIAIERFGGWVDAIVVDGVPGEVVDNATPWHVNERRGLRGRVRNLDMSSGHFVAEALSFG